MPLSQSEPTRIAAQVDKPSQQGKAEKATPVKGPGTTLFKPGQAPGPGRPKKHGPSRTASLETETEPLPRKIGSLRYKSAVLADRLAVMIAVCLDTPLDKKDLEARGRQARLVREYAWSYGVLFDKASGGESNSNVTISFPAAALAQMQLGVAIQVKPKPIQSIACTVPDSDRAIASVAVTPALIHAT